MLQESLEAARRPRGPAARWAIVALLGVIAACLLVQVGAGIAPAQAQTGSAKAGNLFAVAGQVDRDTYGLYLVDLESGTICVYQYLPTFRKLRLMAARTTAFDRKLEDYNTEPPPREMKKLAEQHRTLDSATTQP
jgi:hypothetical protein